jgi:hypothetical protein
MTAFRYLRRRAQYGSQAQRCGQTGLFRGNEFVGGLSRQTVIVPRTQKPRD